MVSAFGRCSICTLLFNLKDVSSLKCGHTFHYDCIKRWINSSKTCPNCRVRNIERDITKLYFDEPDVTSQSFCELEDIDELRGVLKDEREASAELLKKTKDLKADITALTTELQSEKNRRKKETEDGKVKEQLLRSFESRLENVDHLKHKYTDLENKYRACTFYNYLKEKGNVDKEMEKYLTASGDISGPKFLALLKKQLEEAKKINKALSTEKKQINNDCQTLKSENQKLAKELAKHKKLNKTIELDDSDFNVCSGGKQIHDQNKSFGFSMLGDGTNDTDFDIELPAKMASNIPAKMDQIFSDSSDSFIMSRPGPSKPRGIGLIKNSIEIKCLRESQNTICNTMDVDELMALQIDEFQSTPSKSRYSNDEILILSPPIATSITAPSKAFKELTGIKRKLTHNKGTEVHQNALRILSVPAGLSEFLAFQRSNNSSNN